MAKPWLDMAPAMDMTIAARLCQRCAPAFILMRITVRGLIGWPLYMGASVLMPLNVRLECGKRVLIFYDAS
jgi:hypothetical protein